MAEPNVSTVSLDQAQSTVRQNAHPEAGRNVWIFTGYAISFLALMGCMAYYALVYLNT